jgi:hypothetical protein
MAGIGGGDWGLRNGFTQRSALSSWQHQLKEWPVLEAAYSPVQRQI